VPFVFSAASILAKDPRTGQEIPWNQTPNASWIDGSVDNDLPMTRLAEMFNVNHFIVSQVNPHVVPFLAREEEVLAAEATSAASPGWVHELAGLAKGEALHRLQVLSEMGIFPNYLSKARSILNQRYSGDITIFPSISYSHFPKVLSNPTPEYMAQCLLRGERATWPKLSRIQNHLAIELALDETIRQIRARTVFTPNHGFNPENTTRPLSGTGRARDASKRRAISRSHDTAIPSSGITFHSPGRTRHPLVHLPSSHGARRHLLMSRTKKRATSPLGDTQLSSSASGASSEDDMSLDSDAYHKPPNSEYYQAGPPHRRLFPHASQPSTPSFHDSYIAHQSNSSLNLDKASEAASERPIQSHIRQEARRPTQFPTMTPSTLQETECMSDTTATTSEQDAEPAIQNSRPNRC
jgi:TAG lipase/steryl ester hydrolase/phospholipase A2/LPA acyltransferase